MLEASDGSAPTGPEDADESEQLDDDLFLVVRGGALAADDRRVMNAFAAHLGAALDRRRLRDEAATAAALAEANALRAALLQAVSHDLRTPLAGIKASVSSLRQPDVQWSAEQRSEFEATIEDETDRLTKLVGDLLDMSRIQADVVRPELRAVALDEVVPAALHSLGARANGVQVDVVDTLPPVTADPALLERVVANLVDNAIVHTRPGTTVRVEAGEVAGAVHLRVIDRGAGIDPTQREQAFEPFQRLGDDGRTSGTGVGLGLAVARGFTRAIGGELSIDDTPGGGTTMVVTLRPATAGRPTPISPRDDRWSITAMSRVLVVDDEPPILRALGVNLKARGYEVDLAPSGEDALQLAARHHPDAVVLDLGLPGISGLDVIVGLRGWTEVPIIVLSARDDERDKVAALDLGADDYVTKPFGMDELLARLRVALRRGIPAAQSPSIATADFTIDLAVKRVRRDGEEVRLTPTEWQLVETLARHAGKLVTQRQLLQEVWGPQYGDESNYLRVHMAHIRRKLEPEPSRPRYFITEPGMGYRFEHADPPGAVDPTGGADV